MPGIARLRGLCGLLTTLDDGAMCGDRRTVHDPRRRVTPDAASAANKNIKWMVRCTPPCSACTVPEGVQGMYEQDTVVYRAEPGGAAAH